MFEWSQELSVGIHAIDADHMAFFELAKLIDQIKNDPENVGTISSSLAILNEYVDGHFLREEKAMRKVNYPHIAGHKLKHNQFRARVKAIEELYLQGTKSAIDDLPELVAKWLKSHIASEDQKYKNWLNNSVVDDRALVFLAIESETG
ncbi:bacteriohemerythrin [Magnetospirillum sp. LM-5]|uniref:bacteriohemerythrin n=1 Tax=Magnetospirillum sp. LM-5 TaxID=2681466 RepID=UPI0020C47016|nr:hemerythrin family protein [Magnetospirillum sp. LM-5]